MSMKFHFKSAMIRGEKKILLVKFSGILPHNKLPVEYIDGNPFMRDDECGGISIYRGTNSRVRLRAGSEFSTEEYRDIMKTIKEAGKRLADINARLREEARNWEGKEWEVVV